MKSSIDDHPIWTHEKMARSKRALKMILSFFVVWMLSDRPALGQTAFDSVQLRKFQVNWQGRLLNSYFAEIGYVPLNRLEVMVVGGYRETTLDYDGFENMSVTGGFAGLGLNTRLGALFHWSTSDSKVFGNWYVSARYLRTFYSIDGEITFPGKQFGDYNYEHYRKRRGSFTEMSLYYEIDIAQRIGIEIHPLAISLVSNIFDESPFFRYDIIGGYGVPITLSLGIGVNYKFL